MLTSAKKNGIVTASGSTSAVVRRDMLPYAAGSNESRLSRMMVCLFMFGVACLECEGAGTSEFFRIKASGEVTITDWSFAGVITWSSHSAVGTCVVERSTTLSSWTPFTYGAATSTTGSLWIYSAVTPPGMSFIPAGHVRLGDILGDWSPPTPPARWVYVSPFYMERTEVSKGRWDAVCAWAATNGYQFQSIIQSPSGKATNHPIYAEELVTHKLSQLRPISAGELANSDVTVENW